MVIFKRYLNYNQCYVRVCLCAILFNSIVYIVDN